MSDANPLHIHAGRGRIRAVSAAIVFMLKEPMQAVEAESPLRIAGEISDGRRSHPTRTTLEPA